MDTKDHYRFALISDIHIDRENEGKNIYFIYAERNFRRALQVIKSRGCDFVISAGDQITNASGADEEWRLYRSVIDNSGYTGQVYEALGNHETRSAKYGINTLDECISDFIGYTRLDKKDVVRKADKPYYTLIEPVFGDVFIFMALENGYDTNSTDNFSDEQMDEVEASVGRYTAERRRVFIIQHANIYAYGAGDDTTSPAYEGAVRAESKDGVIFKNNLRFKELIEKYRDVIWLSGHTHVDLADGVNYSGNGSQSCHMLHIPALCGTTRITSDGSGGHRLDRDFYDDSSQGYIVDVYPDRAVFSGIDFITDELYPQYTYTIKKK